MLRYFLLFSDFFLFKTWLTGYNQEESILFICIFSIINIYKRQEILVGVSPVLSFKESK